MSLASTGAEEQSESNRVQLVVNSYGHMSVTIGTRTHNSNSLETARDIHKHVHSHRHIAIQQVLKIKKTSDVHSYPQILHCTYYQTVIIIS